MSMVWNTAASVVQKAQQLDKPPLIFTLFFIFLFFFSAIIRHRNRVSRGIPPGTFGWPLIGETVEFLRCQKRGSPHQFFDSRTQRYGNVFTTFLLGHPTVVFCGPEGNRFLFANENKLVVNSCPTSLAKLFGSSLLTGTPDDAKRLRRMLMTFLRPEALQKFVGRVDSMTKHHLAEHWIGKDEVTVLPLVKRYTFNLVCDLFVSINDQDKVARLSHHFAVLMKGVMQIPIDLPGTRYNKAKHAANAIREQLGGIIDERKIALEEGKACREQDLLSFLLCNVDEQDEFLTDDEIKDTILLLLSAGHDTSSCTLTVLLKFLAENPQCYQQVLREQLEIARSKESGRLLEWLDLQKMKYSWRAAQEALRLLPPVQGAFRKAIKDFTYGGFTIVKEWKIHWTVNTTHKKAEYFENPEEFDPSRFEGAGPPPYTFVPFGGGPRMCPGIEFARIGILVFLHHVVKNFKWNLVDPSEKVIMDPMPDPVNGLPITLFPH
uniref:Cytochrome P450 n=1 Tax=Picea sitchensis TaxID=3332 RepID=B8LM27_PICSI|nr:unknown [Picea sitchensis]